MKYSHWVALISAINVAIIFTISWSVFTLMTMIFSWSGRFEADFSGQPGMFIVCLLLSAINTPLLAFPAVKYPERLKTTMIYCVLLPFIAMIIGGVIGIGCAFALTVS